MRLSQMYWFSGSFPYKLANSILFNEKAELRRVAQKRKRNKDQQITNKINS